MVSNQTAAHSYCPFLTDKSVLKGCCYLAEITICGLQYYIISELREQNNVKDRLLPTIACLAHNLAMHIIIRISIDDLPFTLDNVKKVFPFHNIASVAMGILYPKIKFV